MESRRKIAIAVGLTFFFLIFGTAGYVKLENYTILDAFYMTVITVTTVGYGEIKELSGAGRIFTIFLIMSGVGSVAFAAAAFTESVIERASNPNLRKKAMKRKIEKLREHYIICGHGRVGGAAADHFNSMGADFVVIENSEEEKVILEEKGYNLLVGDATTEKVLLEAGIKKAAALMALLDSDPENLFTVLTARELNPTLNIIARTEVSSSESRILRAGADSVISPYASAGKTVASKVLKGSGFDKQVEKKQSRQPSFIQDRWMKIDAESGLSKLLLSSANVQLGGEIIGVRSDGVDTLMPPGSYLLNEGDEILVSFGDHNLVKGEKKLSDSVKNIVLIDDNPVIRRLYTRLFQKAGYNIYTAEEGKKGYELIKKIEPEVAVIDFMLPDISGLEVCRMVRQKIELEETKIILFTADDKDNTRKRADAVGVDHVVLKSPDASEIIGIVAETLENN